MLADRIMINSGTLRLIVRFQAPSHRVFQLLIEASRAHADCFKNKEDCFTVTILKHFKKKQTALLQMLPGLSSFLHEQAL